MTVQNRGELSEAKRALLARRLQGRAPSTATAITRRPDAGAAPLSVSQEQLWFLNRLAPDSPVYNEAVTIRKDGAFDAEVFRSAFDELVRRHEIWRTTFPLVDGVPVQRVGAPPQFALPLLDLSHLSLEDAQARAVGLVAEDLRRPYDLARGPLVRPHLVRLSAHHHRLYLGLHHIIFDGVTLYRTILPELITLYEDFAAGRAASLGEPALQYSDYAVWERQWAAGPVATARTEWWRRHLADQQALELPLDHSRPTQQRFRGAMEPFSLEADVVDGLRELGRRHGATLFHTLAAGFAALLSRYSGQEDVVFGTVGDLRQRPELQQLVGYCLTPFVVRTNLGADPTFEDLLGRVRTEIVDGLDHLVPFERVTREIRPARDGRANPLFQVTIVLEPKVWVAHPEWSLHQLEAEIGNAIAAAKFDLALECDERPEGHISGRLSYDTDLFLPGTAKQLTRHFCRLLREVVAHPSQPVSALALLSEEEQRTQLEQWNDTDQELAPEPTVHGLISAQARRTPERVAVVHGAEQLTYRELDDRADALARRLRTRGAGEGTIVAVCLERSLEMVVGLLGVLKSGAAYLPLDPRLPADRLELMVEDAGVRLLLSERRTVPPLAATMATVLLIDDVDDPDARGGDGPVGEAADATVTTNSGAYVIYTSGSTGRPKGVLVRHRHVVNYLQSLVQQPGLGEDDAVLAVTTYSFDMSVGDLFAPLITGARVIVAASDDSRDLRRLSRLISTSGATYLKLTPSTWQALIETGWSGSSDLVAVSGGDVLSEALARALRERVAALWTTYGPTETTVSVTCTRLRDGDAVTLGRPIANTRIYVLDSHLALVPAGVAGEICISGAGVTDGYLNRPEETAERFQPDPWRSGEMMYRSGDRGRYLPDGRIQYLGRADQQLKIRGFRIEPGEIEAALLGCDGVAAATVTADGEGSDRRLVAYVVLQEQGAPTVAALRAELRQALPEYMVPTIFVPLLELPRTTSGKVDRNALPAPDLELVPEPADGDPESALEKALAGIWMRVLGVEHVSREASFFDLGGHSLLAVRMLAEVERELGVIVPVTVLFQGTASVRELARAIGRLDEPPDRRASGVTTLFFVHPYAATVPSMRHFTGPLGPGYRIEARCPDRPDGRFDPACTVEDLARGLMASVRASQPSGPYVIAGYSIGGLVAYELARQLIEAGESVAWLGMLDSASSTVLGQRPSRRELFAHYARRGPRVLLDQCRSAVKRELQAVRVRLAPDPDTFDHRGANRVATRYVPTGLDGRLTVFATEAMAVDQRFGAALGWDGVHRGSLELHRVPGNHDSLLMDPHVGEVAEVFARSLRSWVERETD